MLARLLRGKMRESTAILIAVFVLTFVTYILVRPLPPSVERKHADTTPTPSASTSSGRPSKSPSARPSPSLSSAPPSPSSAPPSAHPSRTPAASASTPAAAGADATPSR